MARKFKSPEGVSRLAATLKSHRESLRLTLKEAGLCVNINYGQLSRFENGIFKTSSPNLQKYANFLQITDMEQYLDEVSLGERLERFAALSSRHRKAAEELLGILEGLS